MQLRRPAEDASASGMMPLLDVVLLLLIFFMVTTTFRTPSLDLELPEASTAESSEKPAFEVTVAASGEMQVEGSSVSEAQLRELLQERVPLASLRVTADRDAKHGKVISVLDVARGAGVLNIEFSSDASASRP